MSDTKRPPLTRDRVMSAAIALADDFGIERLTIRRLAESLDVRPMTLYHHVDGKEDLLNGIVDLVFAEIELPPAELGWKPAMRIRCLSAREVLARHPWAPPYMESRTTPGPASLRHHEAVLACLMGGGLPLQLTAHAYAILDSYVYGFALQEANLPFGGGEEIAGLASQILDSLPADDYPTLARFTAEHVLKPGYSFGSSFEFGLDLILDGLEAASRRK
jgi:AcrR family transcriptional regulator